MGTDVVVREEARAMVNVMSSEQLKYIAHTEFVPAGLRGNLPAILACVASGRALGIDDMTALRSIHIIDGKATFSAELMVQLVRRRGHSIVGNFSGDSCTVTGKRADNGDEMTVTWTKEMAQEAGLLGKNNWKKYAPSMLWARAVSQLCRMLFADCFAGSTHTPEEIADGDFDEIDEIGGESEASGAAYVPVPGPVETDSASEAVPLPADAPSAAQLKKLNVLVGTLREAGRISTEDVWNMVRPEQTDAYPGDWPRDENGELHWSPLRDSLTKPEASALIERLSALEDGVLSLTGPALSARVREAGIDPALVGVVGRELFPHAESAGALSDVDRGRVWVELEARLAADEIPFGDPDA